MSIWLALWSWPKNINLWHWLFSDLVKGNLLLRFGWLKWEILLFKGEILLKLSNKWMELIGTRKTSHTNLTTKTQMAYGNSPGIRVNTRCINSTKILEIGACARNFFVCLFIFSDDQWFDRLQTLHRDNHSLVLSVHASFYYFGPCSNPQESPVLSFSVLDVSQVSLRSSCL